MFENKRRDIDPYDEEIWDDVDYEMMFVKFLIQNKLVNKYVPNLLTSKLVKVETVKEFMDQFPPERWVRNAFRWTDTSQDFMFWNNIDIMWNQILVNHNYDFEEHAYE
jgi:hypothetical protein